MTILTKLMSYEQLNQQEMEQFVSYLLTDDAQLEEKLSLLVALTMKKETSEELVTLTQNMIQSMYKEQPYYPGATCVCGTGGDGSHSFNISTTVSFIVASAGVPVIKHGNKSITSKSGSIDILKALNVPTTKVKQTHEQVNATNLAFLSATETYPVMKHIQPLRKRIPVPTVFNVLGPMINPFKLDYQVMGVYEPSRMEKIAQTLQALGRKKAIVVHGANGMDEATLSGDNLIYEMDQNDGITSYTINAQDFGLAYAPNEAFKGGTPEENKAITLNILSGEDRSSRRDVVVLNAALALYVSGHTTSIAEGVQKAQALIDDGSALAQLNKVKGVVVCLY